MKGNDSAKKDMKAQARALLDTFAVWRRSSREGRSVDVAVLWKGFLVTFFAVNALLLVVHGWFFIRVQRADVVSDIAAGGETTETINREQLNGIVSFAEEQEALFEYIKANPPAVPDPAG